MGVTFREHPAGSGRWVVFVSRGNWRMNHAVKGGKARAAEVARKVGAILDLVGIEGVAEFLRRGTRSANPIPTVKHYATQWIDMLEKTDHKLSTRKMYESNVRIHIIPALGQYLVTELDYSKVKDFLASKTSDTYGTDRFRLEKNSEKYKHAEVKEKRYSRDTIRIMTMTLRAMMTEAVRDGIIQSNPVEGLSKFYRKRKKDREIKRADIYTAEELYQIEDVLCSKRNIFGEAYEFSLLMSRTGMRIGEARAVRETDVDFATGTIEICGNIPSGHNEFEDSGKTGHSERTVDMSPELKKALSDMLARRREERLKSGKRPSAETPWLFRGLSGSYYDYGWFYKAWNRAQTLAKVRQRSPHALRHTWASLMIEAGKNIAYVSKQLGHANPGITMSIYVHFVPGKKSGENDALDRKGIASFLHHAEGM